MVRPWLRTSSTSGWKRVPPHSAHGTYTSERNCISIFSKPAPVHVSQRPPGTLNENVAAV